MRQRRQRDVFGEGKNETKTKTYLLQGYNHIYTKGKKMKTPRCKKLLNCSLQKYEQE